MQLDEKLLRLPSDGRLSGLNVRAHQELAFAFVQLKLPERKEILAAPQGLGRTRNIRRVKFKLVSQSAYHGCPNLHRPGKHRESASGHLAALSRLDLRRVKAERYGVPSR